MTVKRWIVLSLLIALLIGVSYFFYHAGYADGRFDERWLLEMRLGAGESLDQLKALYHIKTETR
jgi:hypothetical protein